MASYWNIKQFACYHWNFQIERGGVVWQNSIYYVSYSDTYGNHQEQVMYVQDVVQFTTIKVKNN